MLDTNDIQVLRQMLTENNAILKREIRDEMHSLLRGTERRVIEEVTDFIAENIVPQLDDHETRLTRLERKTA